MNNQIIADLKKSRPPARAARAAGGEIERLNGWLDHIAGLDDLELVMHCVNRAMRGDPAP